ncbi:Uncharacterised protein [Mycobacteroides abscessus subsp. bolletii]|uniref:Uncharacterized protein n=1 Tax=Mycobacteroides abscessus subsp. bolletii TaxID=319705 RepID=A0A9Q7WJ56_9MYCO|nr:hypothetical protein [Mycobacteroides abscessus]SHT86820.1 Uncharacterised protein [Mycobacteroides abscessus subsp. bolletii]SHU01490.1 Uncharacterised protein [Mycobacteroides abscessus subsp. bolletii]SHX43659.1 Uncharacterised protein [Mycobacteroides abscessus subsp. bolletii]SKM63486.1 Uncharacterised protein [Mycobacteroides abscessus subsp. bolletii]SKN38309.1 Uncharacterised protein [Mycobacteroides abscessus subsp. bolletii]
MSDGLHVNTAGLRAGAARSEQLATGLTAPSGASKGSGSSAAGVAAVFAAIANARSTQAAVVNGHVAAVRSGATAYDDMDASNAKSTGSVLL